MTHPVLHLTPEPWKAQSACLGSPSSVFFEDALDDQKVIQEGLGAARAICGTCPVKRECLAYAMRCESGLPLKRRYGVWAGTVPEDRVLIDPLVKAKAPR